MQTGRPHGDLSWTLHDLYQVLRARLLSAGLPAPNIRYTDTAGLFRLAVNTGHAPSDGRAVSAAGSANATGTNYALMVSRKAAHVQRDWDERQYGETGEGENVQLDADRMWWRVARWRVPNLKALVFITDGTVNRIREVYGVDEETTEDSASLALHVSPPLSAETKSQSVSLLCRSRSARSGPPCRASCANTSYSDPADGSSGSSPAHALGRQGLGRPSRASCWPNSVGTDSEVPGLSSSQQMRKSSFVAPQENLPVLRKAKVVECRQRVPPGTATCYGTN